MKKKFFTVIFSLIAAIACFFGMAACEPKHEHAYKEEVISPTCENRGYTLHKCDCGEKYETDYVGALGHEFGLYESDGNATYTADGTKTAHCTREGCDKADTVTDTDSKLKSCVIFNTLTKTGENEYKAVVSNAQETFSFVTEVENIGLAEYTVTTDEYGIQQVLTKVAPLNEGDNTFYVFETIDGKITNTYKTTIRRKPTYTVTFDAKGGTAAESQTVEEDSFASAPTEASTRAGYTFDKWDFDFATPITENVTISAKWTANTDTAYKVEYYLKNLENDEYTLQSDETENKTGTTDTTAIAEIKTFAHFTYNESVSTISGNIDGNGSRVLKVYYTRDEYTVTFDGNGGTLQSGNATQTVKYGGTAVAPVYIKTGYSLQWDKPLDNIGGSQTIKARWKVNQYTLTIVYGNGKADEELTQDYGSAITVQDPTRDGYAFDGWNKTIPTTMPAENVTVTAEWKAIFRRGNGVIYGLTDWGKTLSKIEIPDAIDGMDVVSIGEEAFCECENLTIVTIGNNILSIGNNAFKGCLLLNSITIPDSVTSIGGSAFYNCSSLTSMTIPDSVTSIGDYMFYCCRGLTSITIPDSVTSIGDSAFGCCFKLVEVINRSSLPIEKGSSEFFPVDVRFYL